AELCVEPCREVVLRSHPLPGKGIVARIAVSDDSPVRQWKKRQVSRSLRIHLHRAAGQHSVARRLRRHNVQLCHTERLPQPFKVPKYMKLLAHCCEPGRDAKLISAERRLRPIEIVPRIQRTVAQKLVRGAMKRLTTRRV